MADKETQPPDRRARALPEIRLRHKKLRCGARGCERCQVDNPRSSVLGAEWSKWTKDEGLKDIH
jgi:hypothetical protein